MNAKLTLPAQRVITPVIAVLMVIAFAATLALGFGLRAWTEDTASSSQPASSATVATPPPAITVLAPMKGRPW